MHTKLFLLSLPLGFFVAAGCSGPPTIAAAEAKVIGVSPNGLQLLVALDARNPGNTPARFDGLALDVQLPDGQSIGRGILNEGETLGPKRSEHLKVPVELNWTNDTVLPTLVFKQADVPFDLSGHVAWENGSEKLQDLPFRAAGKIPMAMLQASVSSTLGPIFQH